jgi:hypothetical protein
MIHSFPFGAFVRIDSGRGGTIPEAVDYVAEVLRQPDTQSLGYADQILPFKWNFDGARLEVRTKDLLNDL